MINFSWEYWTTAVPLFHIIDRSFQMYYDYFEAIQNVSELALSIEICVLYRKGSHFMLRSVCFLQLAAHFSVGFFHEEGLVVVCCVDPNIATFMRCCSNEPEVTHSVIDFFLSTRQFNYFSYWATDSFLQLFFFFLAAENNFPLLLGSDLPEYWRDRF